MFRTLIVLLVLLALVLAGCGAPAATPAPAAEQPAAEQPAATEPPAEAMATEAPAEPAATEAAAEPAAMESKYHEAPMLTEMVTAGELPSVDDRLPDEPLVEEVAQVGQYGGILRRGFLGPSDHNNYTRLVYDALVRFSPDGGDVIPHIAMGWESNDDFTEWTVNLRPGMKWSDGEPFTADDILFWYNDIALNTDLSPTPPTWLMNADGTIAKVEKVDDYAVKWTYAQPNTAFLLDLANKDGADKSITNLAFAPAHYLKDFHPNYTDSAALDALVKERGFETWTELFAVEALPHLSGNRPSTAAWVPKDGSTVSDPVFTLTRNPYYFAVDQDGNQLPYTDEARFTFFADAEALNLAAIGGEIDMQGRHIKMSNYPVLVENADKGGYRVVTWPTFGGSDAVLVFNQTYDADPAVAELLQSKDFRIALSYAIDRESIKELAFLGLGQARQPVPAPNHPYYPGDEWAFKYTEHDIAQANEILDGLGLTNRDDEGMRTLPDGSRLDIEIQVIPAFANWPDIGQIVVQNWADVGVRAHVEVRERALGFQMRDTNELMVDLWNEDTTAFPFSGLPKMDPRTQTQWTWAPLMRKWYETNGAEGVEPTPEIAKIVEIIDEAKVSGRDRQIELAHELFQIWADNIWEIGTVGLTPMVQGVVVVNKDLMNVPDTAGNDWPLRTPGNTRPESFFYQ
ncbi:MAG: ABC transporter substrate-binding protein [Caldilineae bacterium]|nr:ABC transporter substrate-binding protein [Caldilineae bacterium]